MKAVQIATSKERPWPPEAIERAARVKGDETLAITVKKGHIQRRNCKLPGIKEPAGGALAVGIGCGAVEKNLTAKMDAGHARFGHPRGVARLTVTNRDSEKSPNIWHEDY